MCMHSFMRSTYLPDSKTVLRFQSFNFPPAADRQTPCRVFRKYAVSLNFLLHFMNFYATLLSTRMHTQNWNFSDNIHSIPNWHYAILFLFIYISICNLNFFHLERDFFFTELIKRSQIKSSTSLNIFSTPFNFHW